MKLPYGFEAESKLFDAADPWENLRTIQEFLRDRKVVPPRLAHWLGEAIKHCHEDPDELLRRLGLKKGRGKPSQSNSDWLLWGARVCELEAQGYKPERAIEAVLQEAGDKFSRSQLQKLRDKYRKALSDAQRA